MAGDLRGLMKDAKKMMEGMKEEDMGMDDIITMLKIVNLRIKRIDINVQKLLKKEGIDGKDE